MSEPAIRTQPRGAAQGPRTASSSSPRIAVIVLNWNGLEDTRACVRSLLDQRWTPTSLVVVDNGSEGGDADAIEREFGTALRLHRNAENLGFTGGHNHVIRQLLADRTLDYVALLNNDAVAAPDWLQRLVADAETHPECGLFASHMVFWSDPERTENAGTDLLTTGEAVPHGRGEPAGAFTTSEPRLGACGGAVMYRARMLREIGVFRDDFFANFEDVDLSLRALATGWECRFVAGAMVRHHLNRSIDKVRNDEFRIHSVRNLSTAYWINVPWPVVLLNSPWLLFSYGVVPIVALLVGQWDLFRIVTRGRLRTLLSIRSVLRERRRIAKLRWAPRRVVWPRFWTRQRSCVGVYWRFFVDVVVLRRRRYMQ